MAYVDLLEAGPGVSANVAIIDLLEAGPGHSAQVEIEDYPFFAVDPRPADGTIAPVRLLVYLPDGYITP